MRSLLFICLILALPSAGLAGTCEGVPAAVVDQLKEDLAGRHSGNYSIQLTLLKKQCQDYLALQAPELPCPPAVASEIKAAVSARHPVNFSIQRTLIEKQCQDYMELQR